MRRLYNEIQIVYLALLWLVPVACNDIEQPSVLTQLLGGSHDRIGVVSSDLSASGRFSVLAPGGLPAANYASIHSDAVVRYANQRIFIVNRLNRDNIQVLNPELLYLTEREISVGVGSNPHDIAVAAMDRAYVPLYERNYLQLVNPLAGVLTGRINLAVFADADGIPEMSGAHIEGNLLYVALQRLDRNAAVGIFPPADFSYLIEIDTLSNQVVQAIVTPFANPFGKPVRLNLFGQPHLVWAMPGRIGAQSALDGGIVAFNLNTRSFRPGALYHEATAGGDILDVAVKNDTTGYALIHFPDHSTALHRFNPGTGALQAVMHFQPSTTGFVAGLLLAPNGYLYVAESGFTNPGILIFDTNAGDVRLTPLAVQVGLRPTDLVYIP